MSDIQNNIENSKEEITLKELILKIKEYVSEIRKNWLIVLLLAGLGGVGMLYRNYITPTEYTATLTFMVNSSEGGSGLAGASSILSSLGVSDSDKDNLDKILALSKSMRIIQEAILLKVLVNGKEDFLGNHIVKQYDFDHVEWKKSPRLQEFVFKHSNIDSFSLLEKSALKSIFGKIVGQGSQQGLMLCGQSRQTQIMTLNVVTTSDELSVVLCKSIFKTLSNFYIAKTVEREQETFKLVKAKVDSLKRALSGSEFAAAKFEDTNRGLFMETVKVPTKQLGRDVARLTFMYTEAIKNLEVSDFALKSKRPYVQPIDIPFSPLGGSNNSLSKSVVIGILAGLIMAILIIIAKKLIQIS